jgi:ATP-dependent Lon protease
MLELKLTGQIGDVMQESMNVAKTVAWNLTPIEKQMVWIESFQKTKNQGIHIHCPEGSIKKDGPSGGCCITVAIYSLFNALPIRNTVAITGEIDLNGNITAIGGLEYKVLGGIRSGITHFVYPEENEDDYKKLREKYADDIFEEIVFTAISHIDEIVSGTIKIFD